MCDEEELGAMTDRQDRSKKHPGTKILVITGGKLVTDRQRRMPCLNRVLSSWSSQTPLCLKTKKLQIAIILDTNHTYIRTGRA
jgi:hypothetical protein